MGRHGTTRVDQARERRGCTSSTMYISSVLTMKVALDGCPVVAPILSSSAWGRVPEPAQMPRERSAIFIRSVKVRDQDDHC